MNKMGQIITFYSYKGGVGRSMALANIGIVLSTWGYKVLMVDWDLEAPGLEVFFKDYLDLRKFRMHKGILDILADQKVDWKKCCHHIKINRNNKNLQILTAGKRNATYFKRVRELDVSRFYLAQDGGLVIESLRNEWKDEYDFVLIDSRTGITDIGGICTIQLPDLLMLVFTATEQSFFGALDVAEKAQVARQKLPFDRLNLMVVPIPSKFDDQAEFKIYQHWLSLFSKKLTKIYANWLPRTIDKQDMLKVTKIPYNTYFSFGEKLPILEQGTIDPSGLGYSYQTISALVADGFQNVNLIIENRDEIIRNVSNTRKNFFISFAKIDRSWSEWIAWTLEENGYSVILQAWDFRPGADFVAKMRKAAVEAERTLAVVSPDALQGEFSLAEWNAAFRKDPTGEKHLFIPVRVRECDLDALLAARIYIDLIGLDEDAAREALLRAVDAGRAKPSQKPGYPRAVLEKPRFPGTLPPVWNVPHLRNPLFTGRDDVLASLHKTLTSGHSAALTQAIHGLGGIGKTQVALEYVYRNMSDYTLVWWLAADEPVTLASEYAALATALNLPEAAAREQEITIAAVRQWLGRNRDWLLVFDNVQAPADIRSYLPRGGGHVLVTSRDPNWRGLADPLALAVLPRPEAVAFLRKRTGLDDAAGADRLAAALGDLPLALEQAAAYLSVAGLGFDDYLALFEQQRKKLLAKGERVTGYPDTVATTWEMAFRKLQAQVPAAIELLDLCAFLAPEEIPLSLFEDGVEKLPDGLAAAVPDELAWHDLVAALRRYALVALQDRRLTMHRLVQMVIRGRLSVDRYEACLTRAVELLSDAFPSGTDPSDYRFWPTCETLLAHGQSVCAHADRLGYKLAAATLLNQMGLYLKSRAQYAAAEPLYRRALAIRETKLGPEYPDVAQSLNNLAGLLYAQGDYAAAEPLYRRALAISEKALGPDHAEVAQILNNLALLVQAKGDYAAAESLYRRAMAIWEKRLGKEHPQVATGLNNLAGLLEAKGDYAGAEPLYRRALAIREDKLGPEHPDVAQSLNNLAELLRAKGDYAGAEPLYRRALAIGEKTLGPDHPAVATRLNNLAELLRAKGDYAAAEPLSRRALAIREDKLGPEHPDVATSLNNLAGLLQYQGDYAGAEPLSRRALAIREARLGPEHPDMAQSLNNLAELLRAKGDYAAAEPLSRRAIEIGEKTLGTEHPDVAVWYNNLAGLLYAQGDYAGAEPLYRRSLAILKEKLGTNNALTRRFRTELQKLQKEISGKELR